MRRNLAALAARLRFDEDDPQRHLHVAKRDRLTYDPHDGTDDATVAGDNQTDDLDRDEIRARGDVVSAEDLQ